MILRRLLSATGLVLAGLALSLSLGSARSAPNLTDDDDDEKAEAQLVARHAFVENCLMCHGEDMTSRQRLTPKQWTAEVEKMIGWGTPLPPERKDGLIAWLSATYPHTQPAPPLTQMTPDEVLVLDHQGTPETTTADPKQGAALFTQHCAVCHGPAARGGEIGVNLVTKPILTRAADFHEILTHGRRRMPNFATVLDDRARSNLLAYLQQTH